MLGKPVCAKSSVAASQLAGLDLLANSPQGRTQLDDVIYAVPQPLANDAKWSKLIGEGNDAAGVFAGLGKGGPQSLVVQRPVGPRRAALCANDLAFARRPQAGRPLRHDTGNLVARLVDRPNEPERVGVI